MRPQPPTTPRPPWPAVLLLAACALLAPLAAVAEPPGEEPEPTGVFIDAIEVNVVNVEVFVTDAQGRPVGGLTKDDFELYEDGRPVEITNFYAVDEGRPSASPAAKPPSEAPAGAEPEPAAGPELPSRDDLARVPASQRLHLIIYFDNLFLRPFNRNKVIRYVRQFLHENVGPEDRVMLVTFDRTLHVRHPFTSNVGAIGTALYEVETLTGYAEQGDTERRDVLQRIDMSRTAYEALDHADFWAKSVRDDLERSVEALKGLVGSLAGLEGRKAILYVSDGLPMNPAQDLFFLVEQRYSDSAFGLLQSGRYGARRLFRELTARANANRVTFYALEAAGLRSHQSLSAEYGGSGGEQMSAGSRAEIDFISTSNHQEPLQLMALETGGLAAFNTSNFAGALAKVGTDLRSYYSLGYAPGHSGDGRYHDLRVRLKRKDLKVRHRSGYRDKTSEARVADGTLAALLFGIRSNPLEIEVDFEPERASDQGYYLVPLRVRIPLGRVALVPQGEHHVGRLRVSVAVVDAERNMSPVEQTPLAITVPEAEIEVARTQYYVYAAELMMFPGEQQVAVGVRDEIAGQTSYLRQPVRIGR